MRKCEGPFDPSPQALREVHFHSSWRPLMRRRPAEYFAVLVFHLAEMYSSTSNHGHDQQEGFLYLCYRKTSNYSRDYLGLRDGAHCDIFYI